MPWTGEDTKDVLKKVLGGLIAAAILAIVYSIVEESEWYVALLLGVVLFVLILMVIWRLGSSRDTMAKSSDPETRSRGEEHPAQQTRVQPSEGTASSLTPERTSSEAQESDSPDDHPSSEAQQKAAKKAAKAEEKRLKKEAKSREKSAKP